LAEAFTFSTRHVNARASRRRAVPGTSLLWRSKRIGAGAAPTRRRGECSTAEQMLPMLAAATRCWSHDGQQSTPSPRNTHASSSDFTAPPHPPRACTSPGCPTRQLVLQQEENVVTYQAAGREPIRSEGWPSLLRSLTLPSKRAVASTTHRWPLVGSKSCCQTVIGSSRGGGGKRDPAALPRPTLSLSLLLLLFNLREGRERWWRR
jgi:hypothetical protein